MLTCRSKHEKKSCKLIIIKQTAYLGNNFKSLSVDALGLKIISQTKDFSLMGLSLLTIIVIGLPHTRVTYDNLG